MMGSNRWDGRVSRQDTQPRGSPLHARLIAAPSRSLLLLLSLCAALSLAALLLPPPSRAIGKATPTAAIPLDGDEALKTLAGYLDEANYRDAIELAGRVLRSDAESWQARYYRGLAHARLEDYAASLLDLNAALEIRPWSSGLLRLRGDVHLQNRDPRLARRDYERSLFYNPQAQQTYQSLAALHERDVDKTIRDLYQALLEAARAQAAGGSNRASDILTDLIEAYDRGGAPRELGYAYYLRARIWIDGEDWGRALADLDEALTLQPEMQDYYLSRGFAHEEAGDEDSAARDYYRRISLLERESVTATLERGSSVTLEMEFGLVARLQFEGRAGQAATIAARDALGDGVDPLLALLDPAGIPVAGDDDGGGLLDALIGAYELRATGQYTAVVSHANAGYEGRLRVSLR